MQARKCVIQGGTSAGKTYAIIPVLINMALSEPRLKITVVAETLPAVKEGALDIFKDVMLDTGRWIDPKWNASNLTYTFGNKSKIQFKSFDTVGKAKSAGKRHVLFLNEANHIPFEIADALMIRSTKKTFIDFNPDNEFWVHTEVLTEPNSEFLLLTYLDNEACPPETIEDLEIKQSKAYFDPAGNLDDEKNIKSAYWANWWRVYGLGLIGRLQGVVLPNWSEVDGIPADAKLLYNGIDFGFSISKFASIDIYQWNGAYLLDELVYETGLTNPQAAAKMKEAGYKRQRAYCDYAEPKSIKELKDAGINAFPCESKTDIYDYAIQKLNDREFFVTKRSVNTKEELMEWVWDEEKKKPKKSNKDHAMNAIVYGIGSGEKYKGKYAAG